MTLKLPPKAINIARTILRRGRALVDRAPAPLSERVRAAARTTRNRRRDQRRHDLGDDGIYLDTIVAEAITQAHASTQAHANTQAHE